MGVTCLMVHNVHNGGKRDRTPKSLNKDEMSKEIALLLGLPRWKEWGKAYEIVKAVFTSMIEALLRGERIKIAGFGIFYIRERAPTRSPWACSYKVPGEYVGNKHPPKYRGVWLIKELPAKKYVAFKPSKALLRLVDPNYKW